MIGGFEQDMLAANNVKITKKEILNSSIRISKPLSPDRDWEGTQEIYIEALTDTDYGKISVSLIQKITIGKNIINIKSKLQKPLSIGLTNMEQEINITPQNNQSRVSVTCDMTVERKIPKALHKTVEDQLELATKKSVMDIKDMIMNAKKGIFIPLN